MRPATLAAVGVLLGLAGLVIWREARGSSAPAPVFALELERLSDVFARHLGPRVSPAGLAELKRLEGFRAEPYRDQAGHWTIGYGHKIKAGESFSRITQAEAERLLLPDVAAAEGAVAQLVTVPLSQGQHDALASFVFNVGAEAFGDSTLLRELNAGNVQAVLAELQRWVHVTVDGKKIVSAGLQSRRAAEAALFVA